MKDSALQGVYQGIVIVAIAFQRAQQIKRKSWLGLRMISCYNKPEIQDFTETGTVDRIWLNLQTFKENKMVKQSQCIEKPDWFRINVRITFRMSIF